MLFRPHFLIVGALVVLFIGAGVFWPPLQLSKPLTVAIGTWPGVEPLVLADEMGILSEEVTILEMPWPSATLRAFENGAADVAVLTLDEMLRLAQSGHDLRVVLVLDISRGADAILAKPDTKSVQELKGKRVGVGLNTVGQYILVRALDEAGMSPADVQMVPINVAESERAFEDQELDAVVTSDPFRTRLLERNAVEIFNSTSLSGEVTRVLAVRAETLEERRDVLQQIVDSHFWGLVKLKEGASAEIEEAISRREGLQSSQFRQALKLIEQPDRNQNAALLGLGEQSLMSVIGRIEKFMIRQGWIAKSQAERKWTDDRLCAP